jgi:hypothetical protein
MYDYPYAQCFTDPPAKSKAVRSGSVLFSGRRHDNESSFQRSPLKIGNLLKYISKMRGPANSRGMTGIGAKLPLPRASVEVAFPPTSVFEP